MVKWQLSPATRAVPVPMVKFTPPSLLEGESAMPVEASQARLKAPLAAVTGSLKVTLRSPAEGKLVAFCEGTVLVTLGSTLGGGATATETSGSSLGS